MTAWPTVLWYNNNELTRAELIARFAHLELTEDLRAKFQYNNLMFMTAGYLAGNLNGTTWEEAVDERLFVPLGMERSNFSVEDSQKDDNFALPHGENDDVIELIPFRNIDAVGPAGSINSSAAEMAKYVQFHLDYGKVGDEQLLSEANARSMQSPQMVMTGPLAARVRDGDEIGDPSYGLGLMVGSYRGRKHVRHGGGIDGFISAMEWLPDDRIGVVVLSNTSGSGTVPTLVVRNVFDRLLEMEPIDWASRARKREKEAKEQAEKAKGEDASGRKPNTSPSHASADYAGSYEHPGYGVAEVALDGESLSISAVGFNVPLEHYHYDIFSVPQGLEGQLESLGGLKVSFSYDKRGNIDRVALPLDGSIDDIVFARLGDASMNELPFLEKMTGEYVHAGVSVSVELRGGQLTLTVPGQPTYTLVPDRDTTFKVKGLTGFAVEFDLEEGDSQIFSKTRWQTSTP